MQTPQSNYTDSSLVDGRYGIIDLVDIDKLRNLFEQFTAATGFTIGFLDHPGMNILIATGWKNICTEFHRCSVISMENCARSNCRLLGNMTSPGEVVVELCENGLVDCATPIIIEGKHIASLATGQMLLNKPDIDLFKNQAKVFGFDEDAYLEALSRLEIVDERRLKIATEFLGSMAQMISENGYAKIKVEKEIAERKLAEISKQQAEERFRLIFEKSSAAIIFGRPEGGVEIANSEAYRLFGFNEEEMRSFGRSGLLDMTDDRLESALAERDRTGTFYGELRCRRKDGTIFPAEIVSSIFRNSKGEMCSSNMFRDISMRKQTEESLQRYKNIVSSTPDAIAFVDKHYRYRIVNDAYCKVSGFTRMQLLGMSLADFVGEEAFQKRVKESVDRCINGELVNYDVWFSYPVLGKRFISVGYFPYRDAAGCISGVVVMTRDVTELNNYQESLRNYLNELSLRNNALGAISQGVLICGSDHKISYANDAFERITGYAENEVIGKNCNILQGAESSTEVIAEIRAALNNIEPFHGELVNYRKDGSPFWNDLSITPVFNSNGKACQFVGVQRDITVRKNAERALRDSQLLITTVFDSLDEHVAVLDAKGEIVAVNETWRRFARENGASKELCDGIGLNYLTRFETGTNSDDCDQLKAAYAGIQDVLDAVLDKFEIEYTCHSPDLFRWFNMRAIPLRGGQGGALVIHENITERRRLERERSESLVRLSSVSRRLVAVQEDARRRLAAALHDSTSPNLAAIGINIEVAAMALAEGRLAELASRMEDNSALVEETAANIREICTDLRHSALDYAGLIPALEAYAGQFSRRTGVVVSFDYSPSSGRLSMDLESALFRLVQEALTNIAKHAMARSVVVTLDIGAQSIVLKVTDDGQGFDISSIGSNPGLGIINMREMSEFSGGSFSIESTKGIGTRICVEINTTENPL